MYRVNVEIKDLEKTRFSVQIEFQNHSSQSIWIPRSRPTILQKKSGESITLIYGYSEELDGPLRYVYVVPEMAEVLSGQSSVWEVEGQTQFEIAFKVEVQVQIRICKKRIATTRVRGHQPLAEYLENSFVIKSGDGA